MSEKMFKAATIAAALGFLAVFVLVVISPLIAQPDVIGVFAVRFANPYASCHSADVLACWMILLVWIIYQRQTRGIGHVDAA